MRTDFNLTNFIKKPAIRQGTVVLFDQGTLTLATFITGVLVARGNSKEEYGIYVLGWSLLLFFFSVQRALVNVPFTVYAPRLGRDELKTYQGSTLVHTAIIGVFSMLGLLAAYALNNHNIPASNATLYSALPWLTIVVAPMLLREYVRNSLLALLKVWESVTVNFAATLLLISLITYFYLADILSINTTFQILAIVYALAAAAMIWKQRREYFINWKLLLTDFEKNWKIARWALIDVFAYTGASQVYPWLLLLLMDHEAVAAYGACFVMASFLTPFLRGSIAYMMPRMAHGHKGNEPGNLMRLLRLSILTLSGPFILWLIVGAIFSEEILTLFYGSTYTGLGILFILLLIRVVITSISSPLESALQTIERADINTGSFVVGAIISLGLGYIFIKHHGLYGAGIAGIVSTLATALWRVYFLGKYLHNSHRKKPTILS